MKGVQEMKKYIGILFVLFFVFANFIYAEDILQFRQFIGGNSVIGVYRNNQSWGIEIQSINKPLFLLGIGPRWTKNFSSEKGIKLFSYLATTNDVSRKHWPISKIEADIFALPSIGKWKFFSRIKAQHFFTDQVPCYLGEDAVGYQASKEWQIQFRSEWKYQKLTLRQKLTMPLARNLTQSLGIGWVNKISSANFNGYIGVETKPPYSKAGWMEIKMTR